MKVLIVSDTHNRNEYFYKAVQREAPLDLIIHLGDIGRLSEEIEAKTGVPAYIVAGNNDYFSMLPQESVIMLGNHKAFITHGHRYGVSHSTRELKHLAKGLGCSVVMYGHTHIPDIDDVGEIICLNPGSLSEPRQIGYRHTYIVAATDDEGGLSYELRELE